MCYLFDTQHSEVLDEFAFTNVSNGYERKKLFRSYRKSSIFLMVSKSVSKIKIGKLKKMNVVFAKLLSISRSVLWIGYKIVKKIPLCLSVSRAS